MGISRDEILAQAKHRTGDPEIEAYLSHGTWRDTALASDPDAVDRARKLVTEVEFEEKECYYNAFKAISFPDIKYGEGFAAWEQAGSHLVKHAWIEINCKVAELTWPCCNPHPPTESVYYGVSIPRNEALTLIKAQDHTGPIIFDWIKNQ